MLKRDRASRGIVSFDPSSDTAMTTSIQAERPTMEQAKQILREHGYTPSEAISWEDDRRLSCMSRESDPRAMGHSDASVNWSHGILTVRVERANTKRG